MTKIKNAFLAWYSDNFYQISWFFIGLLIGDMLTELSKGNTGQAVLAFALAALNYMFVRKS